MVNYISFFVIILCMIFIKWVICLCIEGRLYPLKSDVKPGNKFILRINWDEYGVDPRLIYTYIATINSVDGDVVNYDIHDTKLDVHTTKEESILDFLSMGWKIYK